MSTTSHSFLDWKMRAIGLQTIVLEGSQQDRQYLEPVRNNAVAGKPYLCNSVVMWVPDTTPLRSRGADHLMSLRMMQHWLASALISSRGNNKGSLVSNIVHPQHHDIVRDGGVHGSSLCQRPPALGTYTRHESPRALQRRVEKPHLVDGTKHCH